MNSILQFNKECFVCNSNSFLECHHIFFGTSNRKLSERDGLKIWLCYEHHRGTNGVHGKNGKTLDNYLKTVGEQAWIEHYNKTKEDFIREYGKSYL